MKIILKSVSNSIATQVKSADLKQHSKLSHFKKSEKEDEA